MYDQNYLEQLIADRIEESLTLDYKAADAVDRSKTKDIYKDVSAFANSAGGIIIYGIREDKVNNHLPSTIDPIDRRVVTKEWLEQIILSNIQPRIDGVAIHPIEIDSDINKVVYVVVIPQSTTAHQANDYRYYKRYNFLSVPMYDYEIRDILNRSKHPVIELEFEVSIHQQYASVQLDIYAVNKGSVYANYINCTLSLPVDCLDAGYEYYTSDSVQINRDNIVRDMLGYHSEARLAYGQPRFHPILPGQKMKLKHVKLNQKYQSAMLQWTVHADNASPTKGAIELKSVVVSYPP